MNQPQKHKFSNVETLFHTSSPVFTELTKRQIKQFDGSDDIFTVEYWGGFFAMNSKGELLGRYPEDYCPGVHQDTLVDRLAQVRDIPSMFFSFLRKVLEPKPLIRTVYTDGSKTLWPIP